MSSNQLDDLLQQFSKTTVSFENSGVSFKGKNLKLNNEADCGEVVKAIKECSDLTFLDLEGNSLGVDAAKAIGEALETKPELRRALWKDLFTGRMKTEIPKALAFLGNGLTTAGAKLRELDLSDNAFGPIGVEALVKLLQSPACFQLEELRLNNNGLGITGGKMLADALLALHANSSAAGSPAALKIFIAGRNRLENPGATALAKVFQTFGTLEEIEMPQNGIYHKGINELSTAFINNPNLRILNLNDNTLTAKGAKFLADALPSLQALQILNLGDCLLKTQGALVLAKALSTDHDQLEEVLFDFNEIKTTGGEALVRALKGKTKLKKLGLGGNHFGPAGRKSIRAQLSDQLLDCPSDDCESGSEEESEKDDDDDDDDEEEEESEEESEDEDHVSSPVQNNKPESPVQNNKQDSSVQNNVSSPVHDFITNPSADNFTKILSLGPQGVMDAIKTSDGVLDEEQLVLLIMKVSNLGVNKNDAVKKQSRDFAVSLYKALFTWADKADHLSSVNNTLFVYLDLIKDEDNRLKISWDVDRCISVLQAAIVEKIVPGFTQHILTCCLDRKYNMRTIEQVTIS